MHYQLEGRSYNEYLKGSLNSNIKFSFANIQAKLKVSQPTDPYEQEADRVVEKVMSMTTRSKTDSSLLITTDHENKVDRKCSSCEEKRKRLQEDEKELKINRRARVDTKNAHISNEFSIDTNSLHGRGIPLDNSTKEFMESRFGYDFGNVRIHIDENSTKSAEMLDAHAFTMGPHIVFNKDKFDPSSIYGQKLLSHELVHVIQQGDIAHRNVNAHNNQVERSISSTRPFRASIRSFSQPIIARQPASHAPSRSSVQSITQSSGPGSEIGSRPPVDPAVANLPANLYVDAFESVHYDLGYRAVGGNLSTWLHVRYGEGTSIDINVHDIHEDRPDAPTTLGQMSRAHAGEGGRIFPEYMNASTTPRLAAARRSAIETMEEYNFEFIKTALPGVLFIISMTAMPMNRPTTRTTPRLPSIRASTSSIPQITAGTNREMLGQAVRHVQSLNGTAAQKATLFQQLASQINRLSGGSWSAVRGVGTGGSHVFLGEAGEALIINAQGQLFRGTLQSGAVRLTGPGQFEVIFNLLRSL